MENLNTQSSGLFPSDVKLSDPRFTQRSTNQFWYNPDKDQFYQIDWKGKQSKCDSGGRPAKFQPHSTGFSTLNHRYGKSNVSNRHNQDNPPNGSRDNEPKSQDTILSPSKSITILKESPRNTYLPQLQKFEGYVQFRCPLIKSSASDILSNNFSTKDYFNSQKQQKMQINLTGKSQIYRQLPQINEQPNESQNNNNNNSIQKNPQQISTTSNQLFLDKKNISMLYNSYKNPTTRATEYFQSQRKCQFATENQSKVLEDYAKYLSSTIRSPKKAKSVIRSGIGASSQHDEDDKMNYQEIIRKSALSVNQGKAGKVTEAQKKVIEYSLQIIKQQIKENELKEPPPPAPHTINLNSNSKRSQSRLINSKNEDGLQLYSDTVMNHGLATAMKSSISKNEVRESSLGNSVWRSHTGGLIGTGYDTINHSTLKSKSSAKHSLGMQSGFINFSSPAQGYANARYKSYSELKLMQQSASQIKQYQQLKNKDIQQINSFLSNSPRQQFEKEMQQEKNFLNGVDNEEQSQGFTIENQVHLPNDVDKSINRSQGGRSMSPKIKTLADFGSPFKLNPPAEKKPEEIKLDQLKELKQRTNGRFVEQLDGVVKHGGQQWKIDRQWLLQANPHAEALVKKKEEFELKRINNKKHQKRLQAMALEQDIKIEERKIYKKFIKF